MPVQNLSIKEWSEDDRPREKLLLKGRKALSDAELIAILLGSGTRSMSAVELGKKLLKEGAMNNLDNLSKLTVKELTKFKGIGEAKAITIVAAMEIARRRKETTIDKRETISTSKAAYTVFAPLLSDLRHEEFYMIMVNRANQVIRTEQIGKGGIHGTVADLRIMFKSAVEHLATGIILGHNHPSGNLRPSANDIALTKSVKDAGKIMQIELMDHLIIGDNDYFSMADEGML